MDINIWSSKHVKCKAPCAGGFTKCARLPSGVDIYRYCKISRRVQTDESGIDNTYVFHHEKPTEVDTETICSELSKYDADCTICKTVMKRIRILLKELSVINLSKVSAVCEHCQRSPDGIKCKRCEFIVNKFKCCNMQMEERQRRVDMWMSKIKELQDVLSESVKKTNIEVSKRILKELDPPITRSTPKISDWPSQVYPVVRPPHNTPAPTIKSREPKSDVSKKSTVSKVPTQKSKIIQRRPQNATESSRKKSVDEKPKKVPPKSIRGIFYQLSDRRFIDNGWTILPTLVTAREYGIYKMTPVTPFYDWIAINRCKGAVYYDTGEILAVFKDNGAVTWYYRNGMVALVYNGPEEKELFPTMYVLYSFEEDLRKKQSVLAKFDYSGNGVVYDHQGNERFKYSQYSGEIFDKKIGVPSVWSWHNLNDPPTYVKKLNDTYEKNPDPVLTKIINKHEKIYEKKTAEEVVEVEKENFLKQHPRKFETHMNVIQIKTFRVNEFFALSVIKQSHIVLRFNDGFNRFKLELGLEIKHGILLRKEYVVVSKEKYSCHDYI